MKIVCTIVLMKKNGDVLLQLRDDIPNIDEPNTWTFPGGHREKGEKIKNAALRELEEETGYISQKITYLGKYIYKSNNHFFF